MRKIDDGDFSIFDYFFEHSVDDDGWTPYTPPYVGFWLRMMRCAGCFISNFLTPLRVLFLRGYFADIIYGFSGYFCRGSSSTCVCGS